LIKFPSANRWGKEVIQLTLKFVLDYWNVRNCFEHSMESDSSGRQKEKLSEEILWLVNKNSDMVPNACKSFNQDNLLDLPGDSLQLMAEYLKNLQKQI
jgi:hypothetical protein